VVAKEHLPHLQRLTGVDTMELTGPAIAEIMNEPRAGFEGGYLQTSQVQKWSLSDRCLHRGRKSNKLEQARLSPSQKTEARHGRKKVANSRLGVDRANGIYR
jgi:hypothetical protein